MAKAPSLLIASMRIGVYFVVTKGSPHGGAMLQTKDPVRQAAPSVALASIGMTVKQYGAA